MSIQRKRKIARRRKIEGKIRRAVEREKSVAKKSKAFHNLERSQKLKDILRYLNDGFEKELFIASIKNLSDTGNPVRFGNFAYCMREIVNILIDKYAKNIDEVQKCSWYKPYNKKDSRSFTRPQKVRYAIHGGLNDEIVARIIQNYDEEESIENIINRFNSAYDSLNDYTHVGERQFNIGDKACEELANEVLEVTSNILYLIEHFRVDIFHGVKNRVDEEVLSEFIGSTLDDVDILSTHSVIDYAEIEGFEVTAINSSGVAICGRGTAHFTLQWGSNSDRKKGGASVSESFPCTFELHACVNNINRLSVSGDGIQVDTSSWYQ